MTKIMLKYPPSPPPLTEESEMCTCLSRTKKASANTSYTFDRFRDTEICTENFRIYNSTPSFKENRVHK